MDEFSFGYIAHTVGFSSMSLGVPRINTGFGGLPNFAFGLCTEFAKSLFFLYRKIISLDMLGFQYVIREKNPWSDDIIFSE